MKELVQVVGGAGIVEAAQSPGILDGVQQRIVIVSYIRLEALRHRLRDDQRRHPIAKESFALIPGDKQDAALLPRGAIQDRRHEVAQEGIARGDGAIVHVVAQIRRDEFEISGGRIEVREIGDVAAARRRSADVGEADGGFVLPGVSAGAVLAVVRGRAHKAVERHVLRENPPRLAPCLKLIGQVLPGEIMMGVIGDALRRAAEERQIIRLRRVGDSAVIRRQPVIGDQGIDVRRVRIAHDAAVALVLHHDEIDVAKRRASWHARGGGCGAWRWARGRGRFTR